MVLGYLRVTEQLYSFSKMSAIFCRGQNGVHEVCFNEAVSFCFLWQWDQVTVKSIAILLFSTLCLRCSCITDVAAAHVHFSIVDVKIPSNIQTPFSLIC